MIFPIPGRKCWILVDSWEECAAAQGRITDTKSPTGLRVVTRAKKSCLFKGDGCASWGLCGSPSCRGVLVDYEGMAGIEYICTTEEIYATRWGAERAARRYNKKRSRAGVL